MSVSTATLELLINARDQASSTLNGVGSALGGVATVAGGFIVGKGLMALPGILKDGAQGAAEDELAMDQLRLAVENSGGAYDAYGDRIDDAISRGQDLAFTDGETAKALQILTEMTGSTDEALGRLGSAQDLARAKGISLEQAAKLLGKVSDENTTALKKLGVVVGDNATAQDVLNQVDKQFAGQAGKYAESEAGQMAIAGQQMGEVAEAAGSLLLPVVTVLAGLMIALATTLSTYVIPAFASVLQVISPITSFIGEHLNPILIALTPLLAGAAVVIGGAVVTALYGWAQATWTQVSAQLGLNAAMLPIIAVLAAIGVAIAVLYLAWDSNFLGIQDKTRAFIDWILPYLQAAWDGIKAGLEAALTAISAVWNAVWPVLQVVIETVWGLISAAVTTYLGLIQGAIETGLGVIQSVWGTVWPVLQSVIETVFPVIASVVSTYISAAQSTIETALGIIQGVWTTIWPPLQTVVETTMSGVSTAIGVMNAVRDTISTVLGEIKAIWDPIWSGISTVVDTAINGVPLGVLSVVGTGVGAVKSTIEGAKEGITGAWQAIWDTITGAVETAKGVITGILDGIIGAANSVIGGINGFISTWNNLSVTTPEVKIAGQTIIPSATLNTPDIDLLGMIPYLGGGNESGMSAEAAHYVGGAPASGNTHDYGGSPFDTPPSQQPNAGPYVPSAPPPTPEEQSQALYDALHKFFGGGASIAGGPGGYGTLGGGKDLVEAIEGAIERGMMRALNAGI